MVKLHPRESQGYIFYIPTTAKNIHLKGTISASRGAIKTIAIRLYDSTKCPLPDSQGRIDFGRIILQEIKFLYSSVVKRLALM
jgi:hypothetical protein